MILDEETLKRFGYWPSDLLDSSYKKIVVTCNICKKVREVEMCHHWRLCKSCAAAERHPTEATKEKIRESHLGEKNARYGKHHSEETKKKIREKNSGESHPFFGKHHSEETKKKIRDGNLGKKMSEEAKEKIREARKHRTFPTSRTQIELIFEEICKKYNLPFKYTGDRSFWIGSVNPDFVDCNGKKVAIEIFGDYWHSPLLRYNIGDNQRADVREKMLKKYGWKLVVFWGTDLLRDDVEKFVLSRLQKEGYSL